jgi:hypothetical protein
MFNPQPCANTPPKVLQKLTERSFSTASAEHGSVIKLRSLIVGSQRLDCGFAENTTCASPGIICLTVQLFADFRDSVPQSYYDVRKPSCSHQDKQNGQNQHQLPPANGVGEG